MSAGIQATANPSATKTATKKATRKGAKKAKAGKAKGTKKRAKKANDSLTKKAQSVLDYLAKQGATSTRNAVEREKVLEKCEVGFGVIITLKEKKLMERVDHEDGTKSYFLTAEGKKLASK